MDAILYICLTNKSGPLERAVLRDCQALRQAGFAPLLYCLKDSYLDIDAEQKGIMRLHYHGRSVKRSSDFKNYLDLVNIFKQHRVSLVNCYDYYSIWPLCFILRNRNDIPLVFTQYTPPENRYHRFFHELIFRRVDQIFVPDTETAEHIFNAYPVKFRKITVTGMGVDFEAPLIEKDVYEVERYVDENKDAWILGCALDRHMNDFSKLHTIFSMVKALRRQAPWPLGGKNKIKIIIGHEKNENSGLFARKLREEIRCFEVESSIDIIDKENISSILHILHLWIGHEGELLLSDYLLKAVSMGLPCVLPRSVSHMDFLRLKQTFGESYRSGDARELKDKVIKILHNYNYYREKALDISSHIRDLHDQNSYLKLLKKNYETILEKRGRLVRHHQVKQQRHRHSEHQ